MENLNRALLLIIFIIGCYFFGTYLIFNWSLHKLLLIQNIQVAEYYNPIQTIKAWLFLVHNNDYNYIQIIWLIGIPISAEIMLSSIIILGMVKVFNKDAHHNGDLSKNSKWASWPEIKKTSLVKNKGAGVVLGAYEFKYRQKLSEYNLFKYYDSFCQKHFNFRPGLRMLIDISINEHVLAFAPSRSGKGVGLIIPTIFSWEDSMIILDPKGELFEQTAGALHAEGYRTIFLDTSTPHDCYNPFDELNPLDENLFDRLDEIANILLESSKTTGDNAVFTRNAVTLLRGIMLYKLKTDKKLTLSELAYAVAGYDVDTGEKYDMVGLLDKMRNFNDSIVKAVGNRFYQQASVKDNRTFQSFLVEIEKNLAIFMSPSLSKITSKSDFIMKDLVDSNKAPTVLYLKIDPIDTLSGRMNTVSKLLLHNIIVNAVYKTGLRDNVNGKWTKRKLLFLMDEFPDIGKFDIMEKLLAHAGGYGLKLFLIAQSDKQIDSIYGDKNSIFAGCTHKVVYSPNEVDSAKLISRYLGNYYDYEKHESISVSKTGLFGKKNKSVSTSHQRVEKPLLSEAEILRLSPQRSIILTQTSKGKICILGSKFKFYEDKIFNKYVNMSKAYARKLFNNSNQKKEKLNDSIME